MLSYWARKLALGSIEVQTNIGVSKHHHTGRLASDPTVLYIFTKNLQSRLHSYLALSNLLRCNNLQNSKNGHHRIDNALSKDDLQNFAFERVDLLIVEERKKKDMSFIKLFFAPKITNLQF